MTSIRWATKNFNQLLTKTSDPSIRMKRMAAKQMTARLEGEVAAPARPTPMDQLLADWDI
jgi:hypothetical protein